MDGVGKWFAQLAETSWSLRDGAGTRDRTGDTSLEGWGFTAKLCPRQLHVVFQKGWGGVKVFRGVVTG